ncbi:MAG: hypothetical protein AABZ32_04760 [Bacteroidota bacterium]
MEKGFKYWMRWFCVLPISFLAAIIVNFLLHWVLFRTLSSGDSPFITPYPELPELLLAPFFRAMTVVWVSSQIAPDYKYRTAITFATLWVLVAVASFILGYLGIHIGSVQFSLTKGGIPVISGAIGALVGLYIIHKNKLTQRTT